MTGRAIADVNRGSVQATVTPLGDCIVYNIDYLSYHNMLPVVVRHTQKQITA